MPKKTKRQRECVKMAEDQQKTAFADNNVPISGTPTHFSVLPSNRISGLFRDRSPSISASTLGFDVYAENHRLRAELKSEEKRRKDAEKKYDELLKSGVKDKSTGLPNRDSFNDYLEAQFNNFLRHKEEPIHYTLLDLDDFKHVNDTHGHEAGDALLKMFADKLRERFRIGSDDFCARTGGDEFSILFTHSLDTEKIIEKLTELQEEAKTWSVRTRNKEGQYININFGGFSFGLASTNIGKDIEALALNEEDRDFKSAKELVAEADRVMYLNKKRDGKINIPRGLQPDPSP